MIHDIRQIKIDATPAEVFSLIDTMPNKFPIYKILDTKPFFFIRLLLVDGWKTAKLAMKVEYPEDEFIMKVGDSMGPFVLTDIEKPSKYWFTVKSLFFDGQTGYIIKGSGDNTTLNLDTIAENPSFMEKTWWYLVKPIHGIFSRKVLRIIKDKVETQKSDN